MVMGSEIKNSWLMGGASLLAFGLLYLLAFKEIPDKNIQLFIFLAGNLCGFFFGSSINKPRTPTTGSQIPPDNAGP